MLRGSEQEKPGDYLAAVCDPPGGGADHDVTGTAARAEEGDRSGGPLSLCRPC